MHEVAKRFGIASRVLIDTLADQGVVLKSSSSSVDAAAARTALTTLIERGAAQRSGCRRSGTGGRGRGRHRRPLPRAPRNGPNRLPSSPGTIPAGPDAAVSPPGAVDPEPRPG